MRFFQLTLLGGVTDVFPQASYPRKIPLYPDESNLTHIENRCLTAIMPGAKDLGHFIPWRLCHFQGNSFRPTEVESYTEGTTLKVKLWIKNYSLNSKTYSRDRLESSEQVQKLYKNCLTMTTTDALNSVSG